MTDATKLEIGQHWLPFRRDMRGWYWACGYGETICEFIAWLDEQRLRARETVGSFPEKFRDPFYGGGETYFCFEDDFIDGMMLKLRWGEFFSDEPLLHDEWRPLHPYEYEDELDELLFYDDDEEQLSWARLYQPGNVRRDRYRQRHVLVDRRAKRWTPFWIA